MKIYHLRNSIWLAVFALMISLPLQADLLQSSTITAINTELNNTTWAASNVLDDNPSTRWLSNSTHSTDDINFQFNASGDAFCFDSLDLINYGNDDRSVKQFMLLSSSDVGISGDTSTNATGWKPIVADDTPSGLLNYLSWAQGGRLISADSELNTTTWAAQHCNDGNPTSRWLSKSAQSYNILEYKFDTDWNGNTGNGIPIEEIEITNYGNDDRSIKELQIEVTTDGTNWFKLEVPGTAADDLEYVYTQRQEGGILNAINSQLNTTTWAAANIHDGSQLTRWLSKNTQGNNTLEFTFDPNNNGLTGTNGDGDDLFNIDKFYIENYGADDRSIKEFQVAVKTLLNPNWTKITVPGAAIGTSGYDFLSSHHGARLVALDSELNNTTWGADNLHDGDHMTRWLSKNTQTNNTFEFQFDVNEDGIKNAADQFAINSLFIQNYGNDDRSIKEFQVSVKTASDSSWQKVKVPGALIGDANYNFLLKDHGAVLEAIDSQLNTSTWAAKNIHDGNQITRWLSQNLQSRNSLKFTFDVDEDGNTGTANDLFTMESFYLENYGTDDRSIKQFQVAVKTLSEPTWKKIKVPGSTIGTPDHNFLLEDQGGILTAIDNQLNTTTWAAQNIHDGSQMTRWLSLNTQLRNTLDFQFDVNEDGTSSTAADLFTMEKFYLQNYGNDDRSIREFQVAVKTLSEPTWKKIKVPGSAVGATDHNFLLADHGGVLTAIDSQLNTTTWAAEHIHDGNQITRWLSLNTQLHNTLDFQFDVDEDGTTGTAADLFTMENFYLQNYGNDDRSIKEFQVEVKTSSNNNWTKIQVPDTAANDPNYNFSLATHGGELTLIDSELNNTSWAAKNIHDGNQITRWLSSNTQFLNTLAFSFDTDNNGSSGDVINLDTIELVNYGNDDRSIQTFEVDIQISGGVWQAVNAPEGGTIFTANMDRNGQSWSITPQTNVTATRIRTLTNYGDPNYIGASEITFSGASTGPTHTFTAAMHGNGETFSLIAPIADISDVRLRTISNYGDPNYVGAREFKVLGPSTIESSTFIAAMHDNGETFTLTTPLVDVTDVQLITISNHGDPNYVGAREFKVLGPSTIESSTFVAAMHDDGETFTLTTPLVDITDVQLITISNHGDPNYTGAREFKVLGPSITKTATFVAAMHDDGETFVLDNEDIPVDVTDCKLTTISNYGDPNYVGARRFQVLGSSITETKTFVAAMHDDGETFVLDNDDIPVGVTDVKLMTINNHGDPNYVGAREFKVIGRSVTPAHTFILPMQAEPYRIALDDEDTVTGVIGARIVTIRNHGDPNYTGAADFQLLGTAIGPSYVFEAAMDASTQTFNFSPLTGSLLRFHTLNNHGDPNYTGVSELKLNSGVCNSLEVHYLFNEGTGQTVADASGNARTGTLGTSANIETQDPSWVCETTGFQLDFDRSNKQRITTPAFTPPAEGAIAFWMKVPSLSTSRNRIFGFGDGYEIRYENDGYLYLDINKTGSNNTIRTASPITEVDTWMHFAITTNTTTNTWAVYKNGELDNSGNESLTAQTSSVLNVGASSWKPSGDYFNGSLEDFRIYSGELTTTDIHALAATPPVECAIIDHYEIAHSGTGLTCEAEPVTIKACLDSTCSVLATDPTTLDFKTDNNLHSSPTFTGSTIVNVSQTTPATLTLSIANPSIPPLNPLVCNDGTGTSCELAFTNAGFRFIYGATNSSTIANQIAGNTFDTLKIQAVKDVSGVCSPLFSGDVNIGLSLKTVTPNSSDGLTFEIGDEDNIVIITKEPSFTNTTLNFDDDSTAEIPNPVYYDAGEIQLSTQYDDGVISLIKNSNAFWVAPAYLALTAESGEESLNSNSSTSKPSHKAGETFTLNVSAYNSRDQITPLYQPGNMQFKLTRTGPTRSSMTDGFDGNLTYDDDDSFIASALVTAPTPPIFTNVTLNTTGVLGVFSSESAKYSEVGLINLDVQDNNYAGGLVSSNGSIDFVRFTPDHFTQTVVQHGSFLNTCSMKSDYAYSGQNDEDETDEDVGTIKYLTNPVIEITALNADGYRTKNYYQDDEGNDFRKLKASDIEITAPTQDQEAEGVDETLLPLTASITSTDAKLSDSNLNADDVEFNQPLLFGTLHYELSGNDHFFYPRSANTLIEPFIANISFSPAATTKDSDGVAFAEDKVEAINPEGLEIRFARMVLNNSFGPETSNLPLPLQIEYYDGENFIITDDSCSGYNAGKVSLDATPQGLLLTDTEIIDKLINTGKFKDGKTRNILLKAPGADKQGSLKVTYDAYPWFKFDWNNNDVYDDNPTATATFGIFRGNDRVISWREVF